MSLYMVKSFPNRDVAQTEGEKVDRLATRVDERRVGGGGEVCRTRVSGGLGVAGCCWTEGVTWPKVLHAPSPCRVVNRAHLKLK